MIPTWNAAFVYDTPAGTQAAVEIAEFANSQLLQFRYYDELLDNALASIYAKMQKEARWYDALLGRHYASAARQVHALFIDVNELTDRTENALKIVGDVYAARLFALVGARLDLDRWKTNVSEKLKTLDDIYRFSVEHLGMVRGELLEMTIVAILVFELVLFFMGIMDMTMDDVLAIILGGGQGSRLFPLTQQRSKPAVPIGGKYRLIDVPISNCLHADLRRIFVLTQFNSASLNHHVAQTYRMDPFSHGFVDIIAAEQTPDNSNWFQGTADAVRQAARHFRRLRRRLLPDSRRRSPLPDGLRPHARRARRPGRRHHRRRAAGDAEDAPGMGIFRFDRDGQIVGFEEKPNAERLAAIGSSVPPGTPFHNQTYDPRQAVHRVDGHLRVLARRAARSAATNTTVTDFGREIIPAALEHPSRAGVPARRLLGRRRNRRVVLRGEHHAHRAACAVQVLRSAAADLHARAVSAAVAPALVHGPRVDRRRRLFPRRVLDRAFGRSASARTSREGTRITRSVLLGADMYESESASPLGIGRDVVLDRVIMDKNASIGDGARLLNEAGVQHADGDGYSSAAASSSCRRAAASRRGLSFSADWRLGIRLFADLAELRGVRNQRSWTGSCRRQRRHVDSADRALLEFQRSAQPDQPAGQLADTRLVTDQRDVVAAMLLRQLLDDGVVRRRPAPATPCSRSAADCGSRGDDLGGLPRAHERARQDHVEGDVERDERLCFLAQLLHALVGERPLGVVGIILSALGGNAMADQ